MFDEQVPVLEQVGDLSLEAFLLARGPARRFGGGASAFEPGLPLLQRPTRLCYSLDDSLVYLFDNVKLADLVRDYPEDIGNRLGVEWRAVGGDALKLQAACVECRLESLQEAPDILLGWVVIEDFIEQAPEIVVVYNGEHTKGAVVEFVSGDVA